jgi:hypothetical protein
MEKFKNTNKIFIGKTTSVLSFPEGALPAEGRKSLMRND